MATYSAQGTPHPDKSPSKELLQRAGVYLIYCQAKNLGYIGSTRELKGRFLHHWGHLNRGTHKVRELQDIYDELGVDAFEFRILESFEEALEAWDKRLLTAEGEWIARLSQQMRLANIREIANQLMSLDGRLNTCRTKGRGYLLAHPEKIDQQIELWQRLRAAVLET